MQDNSLKPPQAIDAEQGVLGAILKDPDALVRAMQIVRSEDFYHPRHRLIFAAIEQLHREGEPADITTVANRLNRDGKLKEAGGRTHLVELVEAVPSSAHVLSYSRLVKKTAMLRSIIDRATEVVRSAYEEDEEPRVLASGLSEMMADIMAGRTEAEIAARTLYEAVSEEFERLQDKKIPPAFKYGITSLDEKTGGFDTSDLIIVAALSKIGKSMLLVELALRACEQGKSILFISAEMTTPQIARRFACRMAEVSITDWKRKEIAESEWAKIQRAQERMKGYRLHLVSKEQMNVYDLSLVVQSYVKRNAVDFIYVDHLQELETDKQGDIYTETNDVIRELRRVQRQVNRPMFVACQANRSAAMNKKDIAPTPHHLEGSGKIFQKANCALILHRPKKGESDPVQAVELHIHIRDGASGVIKLHQTMSYGKFSDPGRFDLPLDVTPLDKPIRPPYKDGDMPF